MSPAYSSLADRVKAIMPIILDREQKTGKKVMYAFGISHADPEVMLRNHDIVADAGGNAAVININSIGYGGFSFCASARASSCTPIAMVGTSSPAIPASGWTFASISNSGGCSASISSRSTASAPNIGSRTIPSCALSRRFRRRCSRRAIGRCRSPAPGQWGGQAPETFARTGRTQDLLYLCGGGVVSHPGGPAAGVRAVRQAWEAAVAGIPLEVYARDHRELAQSIAKFGGSQE